MSIYPFSFSQITFPDSAAPCLIEELLAARHEYVEFEPKNATTGLSPGFAIPGLYPGLRFVREG